MRSLALIPLFVLVLGLLALPARAQTASEAWDQPLEMCWRFGSDAMTSLHPASDNVFQIFLPQTPAQLIALSLLRGDLLWTVETGGNFVTQPFVVERDVVLYLSTKEIDDLRSIRSISIDSLSGISTSGSNLAISKIRSSAGSGSELAVLDDSRTLRKVGRSGQKWERKLPSAEFAGISQSGDYLFVWARSGDVIVIDSITGRTILEFRLSAAPSGSFSVDRKVVYAGSEDGSVFSIDRVDGEIQWSSRTGGTIDDLTAEKKGVLAISRDNFVYFLSDGNGRRIWKRKLAGRIIGSTKIGKNFAAFLSYGTNEVSILRLQDGKLVNSFPVEGAAHFVSAPLSAGDFLLVPFDSGLAAFAPKGICEREKDGS